MTGASAALHIEVDLLVTPDPLFKRGLRFERVFDELFEQIFVGVRDADTRIDYIEAFVELARGANRPCRP